MLSLLLNFFKRALLIPLAVLLVAVAIFSFAFPRIHLSAIAAGNAVQDVNPTNYYLMQYDAFSDLSEDAFAGTLKGEDFGLGMKAVLYDSDTGDGISLLKMSTEPWNNGCVVLLGKNTFNQFRNLHAAKVGDTVTFEFYDHPSYTYKIRKIIPNVSAKDIASFRKDNTLVMCLPYNDFANLGDEFFYTVYIAK